jgi:putative adenylate-forming enzyme
MGKRSEAKQAVLNYRKMSVTERDALRDERLKKLISYAKANSPYFNKLYEDVGEEFSLQDLPITGKGELMANFDDWVTDRAVKFSGLMEFIENPDNVVNRYIDKYTVLCTSGTTGTRGIFIYDDTAWDIMNATVEAYVFSRKRDLLKLILHGGKAAVIVAGNAFNTGNVSTRRLMQKDPSAGKRTKVINLYEPVPQIVAQLNLYKPASLYAYPSVLKLLVEEARSGRLMISPVFISSGGEHLSDESRALIGRTFGAFVQNGYGCTEGGAIAHACRYGRLHVHDDWIIMEPVDENNKPVPYGKQAEKWLMTALASHMQPIIRYEIEDRVILHDEACSCGNPSPWVEVGGRRGLVFVCPGKNSEVKVMQGMFSGILLKARDIRGFQLIQRRDKNFELRLVADDKKAVFGSIYPIMRRTLDKVGALSEVVLSQEEPEIDSGSGKLKVFKIEK